MFVRTTLREIDSKGRLRKVIFCFKGQLRNEVIATGRTRSRLSCFVEMREITAHLKADTDHSTEGKFNYA